MVAVLAAAGVAVAASVAVCFWAWSRAQEAESRTSVAQRMAQQEAERNQTLRASLGAMAERSRRQTVTDETFTGSEWSTETTYPDGRVVLARTRTGTVRRETKDRASLSRAPELPKLPAPPPVPASPAAERSIGGGEQRWPLVVDLGGRTSGSVAFGLGYEFSAAAWRWRLHLAPHLMGWAGVADDWGLVGFVSMSAGRLDKQQVAPVP